jgi:hypothetical protein
MQLSLDKFLGKSSSFYNHAATSPASSLFFISL